MEIYVSYLFVHGFRILDEHYKNTVFAVVHNVLYSIHTRMPDADQK